MLRFDIHNYRKITLLFFINNKKNIFLLEIRFFIFIDTMIVCRTPSIYFQGCFNYNPENFHQGRNKNVHLYERHRNRQRDTLPVI